MTKILSAISWCIGELYVGLWLMIICPIQETCQAFDSGILTGDMIFSVVIKILLAPIVGTVVSLILAFLSACVLVLIDKVRGVE